MAAHPKVSIIIPMYNASVFLPQCLDSVLGQTLAEIEVLCIDDCSTDDTRAVTEHYAASDGRLRVISMPTNSGPSAARNEGMRQAQGDYLGFVDSDDWVDVDYFEYLLNLAVQHEADQVLHTSFVREYRHRSQPVRWTYEEYPSEGLITDNAYCANSLYCMPYARLISRELVERCGLSFPIELRMHEDDFFHRTACLAARRCVVGSGPLYHYRNTEGSLSNTNDSPIRHRLRLLRALRDYYGEGICQSTFRLRLFGRMLYSQITAEDYSEVKLYLQELRPYLAQSGAFCSDFDRYAMTHIRESQSHAELMKRMGADPWVRYQTLQRIRNNMNIVVSVIIPVYNTGRYLTRCLESVCGQSLRNIEIICVNDASSDESLIILRQFAAEDNRIRIIDLPQNAGVSHARNIGIEAARGQYIYFIDSDDWLDADYLETMVRTMETQQTDIIINTSFVNEFDDPAKKQYSNFDFCSKTGEMMEARTLQRMFPPSICLRLYRRSLLTEQGIRFPMIKGGEDIFFAYACDLVVGRIYVFAGPHYHYYQRADSAMHTASRGFHYIESFRLLWQFLCRREISLAGIKLFYVESLILDTPEKYDFTRNYLREIRELVLAEPSIYNVQELFLMEITERISDYATFRANYNPNISLSFIRHHINHKR